MSTHRVHALRRLPTCIVASVGALALLSSSLVWAQEPAPPKSGEPSKPSAAKSEPTKPGAKKEPAKKEPAKKEPGSGEPTPPVTGKKSDEPGGASSGEPSPKASGEPGAKAAGEPGAKAAGEPGAIKGVGEPSAPKVGEPTSATPVVAKPAEHKFGIGLHIRAMFIHPWLLGLFFDQSTPLNSMGFGGEFIYRRGTLDIIGSIDFGFYSPKDGNFLENGKNPATEVDYISFDGLNVLAFSVHFIKHHEILPWMSFIWGGGVGIGIVLGNIFRVSAGKGCDSETAGDESRCMPNSPTWDPKSPGRWLNDPANQGKESDDGPNTPKRWKEDGVWPVVPIVHLLVGLDFKISDQFGVRIDGGFRNAFYVGATGNYFF